jgi:hypothetical protein
MKGGGKIALVFGILFLAVISIVIIRRNRKKNLYEDAMRMRAEDIAEGYDCTPCINGFVNCSKTGELGHTINCE